MSILIRAGLGALIAATLAAMVGGVASAHERRAVGAYEFVVGFLVEPAFEGEKNGVDLRITKAGEPLAGAHESLQVEVTHLESNQSRTFPLRAVFGAPGRYAADFVTTAAGDYRFRFTGTLEGTAVDEVFESGPGRFNAVESAAEVQFPLVLAAPREVEGAARGAEAAARSASEEASAAQMRANLALVLGAFGLAVALGGVLLASRARRA